MGITVHYKYTSGYRRTFYIKQKSSSKEKMRLQRERGWFAYVGQSKGRTWKVESCCCLSWSRKFDRHVFDGGKQKFPGHYLLRPGPGQARRHHVLSFFTSDDIFSDPSPMKGFYLICIPLPLCLVCFNLIINSNLFLSQNFLFQIRPRDGAVPFILP